MASIIIQDNFITINGQNVKVKDDTLTAGCYFDGKFIGQTACKMLVFTVFNDRTYRGQELTYYRRVSNDGSNWTQSKVGTFFVDDVQPDDTGKEVTVTSYDYMAKTEKKYEPAISFPATLQQVYADLCSQCGLTASDVLDINDSFSVENNQFEGFTCREVLSHIAEITGNFAYINGDDELELMFHSSDRVSISRADYSKLVDKRDSTPITVIVLENSMVEGENWAQEWTQGISLYGRNEYLISDNLFAWTEEKRQALAPALLNKLKGWCYDAAELYDCWKQQADSVFLGTLLAVTDADGNTSNSIVLQLEWGPVTSNIMAPSFVNKSINYNIRSEEEMARYRAEIKVDKARAEIDMIAAAQTETELDVTELQMSAGELSAAISQNKTAADATMLDMQDSIDGITQSLEVKMTAEEVELAISTAIESSSAPSVQTTTTRIDDDGLTIEKTGEALSVKAGYEDGDAGFFVKDGSTNVLSATSDGVDAKNLRAGNYLIVDDLFRFEGNPTTGRACCYWLGD